MPTVRVDLAGSPYDVHVESGLLSKVGKRVRPLSAAKSAALVTDENLPDAHRQHVLASLRAAGFERVVEGRVPAGEDHKSVAAVERLYDVILRHGVDRQTPVIALGGGVIGDTAGFVAATLLRGVPFVQVPTTLLAMVDASVGGKTGVNHPVGKNLVGAFHQPIAVFADPEVLRTLPPRELRGGLAECIKHDVIRDADGFARLEESIGRALALDMDYLTELVAHNVAIKARVVEADPFEKGERAHLNFGHTFGHAIETVSRYKYSHGESVALGMIAACRLSQMLGMLDGQSVTRVRTLIEAAGLPSGGIDLSDDEIMAAMKFDKKAGGGKLMFVLPDSIGNVVTVVGVPPEAVRTAVQSLWG